MTSTATQKPMSASELICAIHLLSKSHLCTLEAVRYSPDTEQDAVAEKLIDELLAFIDKSRPKSVAPELSHPASAGARMLHQLLGDIVLFAKDSQSFLEKNRATENVEIKYLGSASHKLLAEVVGKLQHEGFLRPEVMNSHTHVGNAKQRSPRDRDIEHLHNLANAAVAFARQLADPALDFYQVQKSGTGIELKNALTAVLDEDLVRPESVNYAPTSPQRQKNDYKTPYGHKFSCLSKLALQLADIVEGKEGRTLDLTLSTEHRSICMLIDALVDAGVLPLNSVKKVDGISLSHLQQLFSASITINAPAVTIVGAVGAGGRSGV